MGCDSCSSGSCSTKPNDGLPPGMLQKYRLNIDRSDGFLVWIETERGPDGSIRVCDHCKEENFDAWYETTLEYGKY